MVQTKQKKVYGVESHIQEASWADHVGCLLEWHCDQAKAGYTPRELVGV